MVDLVSSDEIYPLEIYTGPCAYCYATLVIYTGEVGPDCVSDVLGVNADLLISKNCLLTGTVSEAYCLPVSCWVFSSKKRLESEEIQDHIKWIFDQIGPNAETAFEELWKMDGFKAKMHCTWFSNSDWMGGGPELQQELMKNLAKCNLELIFNVVFGSDKELMQEYHHSNE